MRIDLEQFFASSLSLRSTMTLDPKITRAIGDDLRTDLIKTPLAEGETYEVQGRKYTSFIFLYAQDDGSNLNFLMNLTAASGYEQETALPAERILSALTAIKGDQTVATEAVFQYPLATFSSTLSLPFKVPSVPGGIFDEMIGFRIVKLEKDRKVYDVTTERPDERILVNTVRFTYVGTLSGDLPKVILEAAQRVSERFVARVHE